MAVDIGQQRLEAFKMRLYGCYSYTRDVNHTFRCAHFRPGVWVWGEWRNNIQGCAKCGTCHLPGGHPMPRDEYPA